MKDRRPQSDFERQQRGADEPRTPHYESAWERRGPCGYEGCAQKGLARIFTGSGWLNACEFHYSAWWAEHYRTATLRRTNNPTVDAIRDANKAA